MFEFLGGTSSENASAAYIVGTGRYSDPCRGEPAPVSRLFEYLDCGFNIERSLWDRNSLIADLDIDYENFDFPAEAYLRPERAFALIQPTVEATIEVLSGYGIHPLHMIGGRGHHLVWAIDQKSPAFFQLADLGEIPPTLVARYENTTSPSGEVLDPRFGRAFAGLGKVLELVAHRVLALAERSSSLPIQLGAVEVGTGIKGREIVSFDLSEYGDPFDKRHIRIPFSPYLKPRLALCLGESGLREHLRIFQIPLIGITMKDALGIMRDSQSTAELSKHVSCSIPDQSASSAGLIDEYEHSDLARFHREFYARRRSGNRSEKERSNEAELPACARLVLDRPNYWLLKPGSVQHIVRVLMSIGWQPWEISDLILNRFHADVPWSGFWLGHDREYRSKFYVRFYAGLIEFGRDRLIDFNCVSHREKGYCTVPWCSSNLLPYRQALLGRQV
jgi:hypothetical protein